MRAQERLVAALRDETKASEAQRELGRQVAETARKAFLGKQLVRYAHQPHKGGPRKSQPYELPVMTRYTMKNYVKQFGERYIGEWGEDQSIAPYDPRKLRLDVRPEGRFAHFVVRYQGAKSVDLEEFEAYESKGIANPSSDTLLNVLDANGSGFEPVTFDDEQYQFIRQATPMFFPGLLKKLQAEDL